jgi:hypothetical protein
LEHCVLPVSGAERPGVRLGQPKDRNALLAVSILGIDADRPPHRIGEAAHLILQRRLPSTVLG